MTTASTGQAVNWFEIPCADLGRAQTFYERVLGRPMRREGDFDGTTMALFSYAPPATGGCLVAAPEHRAADNAGVLIYLDCAPSVEAALGRVVSAGGEVLLPCTELPRGLGFIAKIRDTEGNTIALHAMGR